MQSIRNWHFVKFMIMIMFSIIAVFPFYMMLNMGTYFANDLFRGIKLLPGDYLIENLKTISTIPFPRFYINSTIIAVSSAILTTLVCSMAGFAFAKYNFHFKNILFTILLLTIMVPTQLSLVGFVLQMRVMGLLDTQIPLIIPPAASAFGAFWMTQYSKKSIPDSILESARIDGCNDYRIFFLIVFPVIMPAAVALALLVFLHSWNSFILPMVILSNENLFTLPLGIRMLATQHRFDIGAQILGLTVGTIPMLLFFAVFSKNLMSGLAAAAVKE